MAASRYHDTLPPSAADTGESQKEAHARKPSKLKLLYQSNQTMIDRSSFQYRLAYLQYSSTSRGTWYARFAEARRFSRSLPRPLPPFPYPSYRDIGTRLSK